MVVVKRNEGLPFYICLDREMLDLAFGVRMHLTSMIWPVGLLAGQGNRVEAFLEQL